MMVNIAFIRFLSVLSLLASTFVVCADQHETRWYDVEVIIFENVKVPQSPNNRWDKQIYLPALENAVSIKKTTGASQQQTTEKPHLLSADTHQLQIEADAIKKSSRYKLLLHQAWRQPGLPRNESVPITIQLGEPTQVFVSSGEPDTTKNISGTGSFNTLGNPFEEIKNPLDEIKHIENFTPAFVRPPANAFGKFTETLAYPLDGAITVALGRYLHVYTDLALTKRGKSGLQSYVVQSHRRMRSRTVHYIDHPKIGILVTITPYKSGEES